MTSCAFFSLANLIEARSCRSYMVSSWRSIRSTTSGVSSLRSTQTTTSGQATFTVSTWLHHLMAAMMVQIDREMELCLRGQVSKKLFLINKQLFRDHLRLFWDQKNVFTQKPRDTCKKTRNERQKERKADRQKERQKCCIHHHLGIPHMYPDMQSTVA